MNFISKIIFFFLVTCRCLAQDEIIDRKTKCNIASDLVIERMDDDNVYYISNGTPRSIPVKNVIAIKRASKDTYLYLYDDDKEKYIAFKGKAYKRYGPDSDTYFKEFLTSFVDQTPLNEDLYKKPSPIQLQHKSKSKKITIKRKRTMYFVLKGDELNLPIETNSFVFNDSMVYVKYRSSFSNITYFKFPLAAIKKMGVQTPTTLVLKYTWGVFCIAAAIVSIGLIKTHTKPIFSFSPIYKNADVVNKWDVRPFPVIYRGQ
ncbi:MAG: hypothetical protein ACXVC6_09585 [Bacteroidia bacterium]